MLTVQRVESVNHLFHPTANRRYTFVKVGDTVRVTTYNEAGRRFIELSVQAARNRWSFLRRQGYKTWEELGCPR